MIEATQLKNGKTFLFEGQPHKVIKYTLTKMGRGSATVRVNVKNLITGSVTEKTFGSNAKVDEVHTTKKSLQFLYRDGKEVVFMDPTTFEQISINENVLKDELPFIKEGENVSVLFWSDSSKGETIEKPLYAEIPPKVTLKVEKTAPGAKGNSATNVYKPAVLENGITVKVPLFIKQGDAVRVDTRTGEYVERAK